MTKFRDYTYLGLTQSLCPECLEVVPAKIVERSQRIYFRKNCSQHGPREDFVCSDAAWFDRTDYSLPGKIPARFFAPAHRGCPFDCGLCQEHEQHTCLGLVEITSRCNLDCPMCFAVSGPSGNHLPLQQCRAAIDHFVAAEGQPEVLQLSGGEPTIHPDFEKILAYACEQPIDIVMINTNGLRFARDARFLNAISAFRDRIEIYLQFDGLNEHCYQSLRGESLLDVKLKAVENLGQVGLNTVLVSTVQPNVNDDQYGDIVRFGVERPWVTGVSFQPATYSGRYVGFDDLEARVTFPDILHGLERQSESEWRATDFSPLPCAHPNAHTIAYAFRNGAAILPIARFLNLRDHLDLLSGRITFDRQRVRHLINSYLSDLPCAHGGCQLEDLLANASADPLDEHQSELATQFLSRALSEDLHPQNMFRITTTSFMDAFNFDIRQLMKSCVHFVLPSGHIIPFSAYNVLYRTGHVPLPELFEAVPLS